VTSYLTENRCKLHNFDRQYRRPQNCPFQSSFTYRPAPFTQGIPQFPQFTCRHHDGIISRHSIHSADEHRMIYSFSNTISYSTFYAFFPFFLGNIMADVASKGQTRTLFLSTIGTRTRRHTELQKTDKPCGKPVLCQRTLSSNLM